MGLGKTIQSIAFLQEVYNVGIHGPFLVIAPLSTITNWEREFNTWTEMNTIVYHGSLASRQMIQQYEMYCKDSRVSCMSWEYYGLEKVGQGTWYFKGYIWIEDFYWKSSICLCKNAYGLRHFCIAVCRAFFWLCYFFYLVYIWSGRSSDFIYEHTHFK